MKFQPIVGVNRWLFERRRVELSVCWACWAERVELSVCWACWAERVELSVCWACWAERVELSVCWACWAERVELSVSCRQTTCSSSCGTGTRSGRAARCSRVTRTTWCRSSSTRRTTTRSRAPRSTARWRWAAAADLPSYGGSNRVGLRVKPGRFTRKTR